MCLDYAKLICQGVERETLCELCLISSVSVLNPHNFYWCAISIYNMAYIDFLDLATSVECVFQHTEIFFKAISVKFINT